MLMLFLVLYLESPILVGMQMNSFSLHNKRLGQTVFIPDHIPTRSVAILYIAGITLRLAPHSYLVM